MLYGPYEELQYEELQHEELFGYLEFLKGSELMQA